MVKTDRMEFPLSAAEERLCRERGVPLAEYERVGKACTGWAEKRARTQRNAVDADALILAVRVGLWQALLVFDCSRGVGFGTFATWKVRGEYQNELRRIIGFTGRKKVVPVLLSLDMPLTPGGSRLGELLPDPGPGTAQEVLQVIEGDWLGSLVAELHPAERASVSTILEDRSLSSVMGRRRRWRVTMDRQRGLQRLRERLEQAGFSG